jgi:hypothetical protein
MKKKVIEMELIADSHHGQYGPQVALGNLNMKQVRGVDEEDVKIILEGGPDHPHYWDTWIIIEQNARIRPQKSYRYNRRIFSHEGDIWVGTIAQFNKAFGDE